MIARFYPALTLPAYRRFLQAIADPRSSQASIWSDIYRSVREGSFWTTRGQDGTSRLGSSRLEDYPITDYGDYESAIRAARDRSLSLRRHPAQRGVVHWQTVAHPPARRRTSTRRRHTRAQCARGRRPS